eukprot:scpid43224/ scgid10256/ 
MLKLGKVNEAHDGGPSPDFRAFDLVIKSSTNCKPAFFVTLFVRSSLETALSHPLNWSMAWQHARQQKISKMLGCTRSITIFTSHYKRLHASLCGSRTVFLPRRQKLEDAHCSQRRAGMTTNLLYDSFCTNLKYMTFVQYSAEWMHHTPACMQHVSTDNGCHALAS